MPAPCAFTTPAALAVQPRPGGDAAPQQVVVKVRRDYNSWVATETMEDYALRYTPQRFRRWSEWRVANTAFGAASFLILEAVGATLLVQYGFINAFWAIVATGLIIFLAGLPISVYAARYGVDMDLLTRGAGFGYIGSTLTSLIYASFTFVFFALEAAVMAYALELALGIPPHWGYLICALVVIPLVTHGVSTISRLQMWTQPLWLLMLVLPFGYVLTRDPGAFVGMLHYGGESGRGAGFDLHLFGAALTVGIALITQMGEQADYLRFMPAATPGRRGRWWLGVLAGGPGWVLPGVLKMLGGALLAWLALAHSLPANRAVDPNQMYLLAYGYVFPQHGWAVAATALFVVLSQMKINVTNAYAGSLAWSNFFSRLTHSHPGRVVWMVFNTLIACMLMQMNVFRALGEVLGLFSNIAIAWIMSVVADLVINKPLGLSPKGIEFKRAHLYDINPVGVGAMALAGGLSISAHLGLFGPLPQAFSALIAMAVALASAPLIAWATQGRYYIARRPEPVAGAPARTQRCVVCEHEYEAPDMARCPAYRGAICSLCCTLDARCGDLCKPKASLAAQWSAALRWLLPRVVWRYLDTGLGHFLLLMLVIAPLLAAVLGLPYHQELNTLAQALIDAPLAAPEMALRSGMLKAYLALLVISGIVAWWLVLAHKSRQVAQEESNRQTGLLLREIELHRQTDQALQTARQVAEQARLAAEQARQVAEAAQRAADQANQAKSRYISAISHELRTPLNSILGYAQLMSEDPGLPPQRQQAVHVIRRGGEHLLSLIEGTLDIARIESGKLALEVTPMRFADGLREMASLFELQAAAKGLAFRFEPQGVLPEVVRADEKRLRQILINLLGNAIKFTTQGQVTLRVRHAREMARIEVQDTGPGLTASAIERIFEPFTRAGAADTPGAGLGLTIAKMLTALMGGELTVSSQPGVGSVFQVKLFLPEVHDAAPGRAAPSAAARSQRARKGYAGQRRRILVVDNEAPDRELLVQWLEPLGFALRQAASGLDALDLLASGYRPHALLLDLAMPWIDGWETLRRVRRMQRPDMPDMPCAIVSANAFDKTLDNDVGIRPEDFIVKPVRHGELLDWLERRLGLQWQHDDALLPALPSPALPMAGAGTAAHPAPLTYPDGATLAALAQVVALGHYRGILNILDDMERRQDTHRAFAQTMRQLARQFQFEAMGRILEQAPA
ncbi:hybrid sensor histidine kinase/response regulator [Verminephrobacter eiseniae]|uniref:hybrid sensor histidine kinase/response regulator n=1 Tax=Verminephrobacter eiseniae TaxID=364317 RepID=UPI0022381E85|nr:ATP-binding protein [Verminephrobacter eiseniae]MCW5234492.1 response regulator [Verminephrobacter eiseniae]MCW5293931.1 response regulator [Verminephrobacter eiseniae]MCW8186026.1 response regulator [Verminephrobacter eiseniae]MCW8222223.1 response regulator [Verminephrobacter eiseniae]MCW8235293.1 response regulator [Verminephrobacter eiseniae]